MTGKQMNHDDTGALLCNVISRSCDWVAEHQGAGWRLCDLRR